MDKQLAKVFGRILAARSTPLSDRARQLLKEGDTRGLVSLEINPLDYVDARSYHYDAVVANFFKKTPFDVGINTADVARNTFWECERVNKSTNDRLRVWRERHVHNGPYEPENLPIARFIDRARLFIKSVLGPIPDRIDVRFGPGATLLDKAPRNTVPDKIENPEFAVSTRAKPYVALIEPTAWGRVWMATGKAPFIADYGRFTTVPKDAKKDRCIDVAPAVNVSLQLGIGAHMKTRLEKVGLLQRGRGRFEDGTSDAQIKHRLWACRASRDGRHATLDLSNASDTISRELVRLLLPDEWHTLLADLRTPFTRVEGKRVWLEKFSAMGNGFTFELETLIFASVCHALGCGTCGTDYSVFGDDMIVPSECAADVCSALAFLGMTVNTKKSFVYGKFRESCGGDFFDGESVRAHYLKELPAAPENWIKLANGLYRVCKQDMGSYPEMSFAWMARLSCLDHIPVHIRRLIGPSRLGDLVINDDNPATWNTHRRAKSPYVDWFRVYRPITRRYPLYHWKRDIVLATILYGAASSLGVTPRDSVAGYRIGYAT